MGIGNILVLSQVTAYVLAAILSFFIYPPVAVNKTHNFQGHCLLNAKGYYEDDGSFQVQDWGNPGPCNFAIFIGIAVMLASVYQIIRLSFHLYNDTDGSFLTTFLSALLNVILTVMLFGSALTVSIGYNEWCSQIEASPQGVACANSDLIQRLWKKYEKLDPVGFPAQWGIAQFGLWSSFLVWFILCCFSFVKLFKLNQQENIVRSLTRERQRLLGEDSGPTVY
ncbi:transmembrane protein 179-like [Amphiura filiformis]|uniref:transmembrane protein 179-like n=1 Tax=Amphiura filiformis TaxID=82378 RepID=UPI003B21A171